jgi:tetratricopeptide (TPR) repeat protein
MAIGGLGFMLMLWILVSIREHQVEPASEDESGASSEELAEIEARFLDALRGKPSDPELHFQLGGLYNYQCNMSAAKASYNQAIALNPLHYPSYFELGKVHLAQVEDDAAERHLKTAAALAPDFRSLERNHYLAELLFHRNRDAEAEGYYRSALAVASQNDARLHTNLALALSNQGRAEEASAVCMAFSNKGAGIESSTEIQWTAPHRFEHDIEQLEYIRSVAGQRGEKEEGSGAGGRVDWDEIIREYKKVGAEVRETMREEQQELERAAALSDSLSWFDWWNGGGEAALIVHDGLVELSGEQLQRLNGTYNQVWNMPRYIPYARGEQRAQRAEGVAAVGVAAVGVAAVGVAAEGIAAEGGADNEGGVEGALDGAQKGGGDDRNSVEPNSVGHNSEERHRPAMLSPALDVGRIEQEYSESNITVIDDLLSVSAVQWVQYSEYRH